MSEENGAGWHLIKRLLVKTFGSKLNVNIACVSDGVCYWWYRERNVC